MIIVDENSKLIVGGLGIDIMTELTAINVSVILQLADNMKLREDTDIKTIRGNLLNAIVEATSQQLFDD